MEYQVKQYLQNELDYYKNRIGYKMKPLTYSKKLISELFKNNNDYGMTISSFCCKGLSQSCWEDPIADGIWDMSLDEVKESILSRLNSASKILYNKKKYEQRLYIGKKDGVIRLFIFARDLYRYDLDIWFAYDE